MNKAIAFFLVATLSACAGIAPTSFFPDGDPDIDPNDPTGADNVTFGALLNNVRVANGAGFVTFDTHLATAAQTHANDMLINNLTGHTGSDGSDPGDRATRAGYTGATVSESVSIGQRDERAYMDSCSVTPDCHAAHIDPRWDDFALAKAGSGPDTHWVRLLGDQ